MNVPLVWEQINQNDVYANAVWQKLSSNDPSLDELYVGQTHGFYPKDGVNWEDLGKAIGNNKHLQFLSISLSADNDRATDEDLEILFNGIAKNRSIVALFFFGGDFYEGKIFTLAIPLLRGKVIKNVGVHTTGAFADSEIRMLSSALIKSSSLKRILSDTGIKKVSFRSSGLPWNPEVRVGLIDAVSRHNLQFLDLCFDAAIGREACAELSRIAGGPCHLHTLNFPSNGLDDECAALLATGLVGNSRRKYSAHKLKALDLSRNENITSTGWDCIFGALQHKGSGVTHLWLNNNDVFAGGCLFRYLRGNCRLALLGLDDCDVDDAIMSRLAQCLVGNRNLRGLHLNGNPAITTDGLRALSATVCNETSIEDTISSNHTLERVRSDADVPSTLALALRVNEKNCDADAARLKILQIHFRVEQGLSPLYKLKRNVWPFAMAWIVREESGLSLLFRFLQGAAGMIEFDWSPLPTTDNCNRRRRVVARMRNALSSRSSRIVKRG